jgi:N-carbamoyl-L-amino-acid hydrolase
MHDALHAMVPDLCREAGLSGQVHDIWHSPPVSFDSGCIESVRKALQKVGVPAMKMVSGAGHDAVYISGVARTSMIFIPCEGGLSHNELEKADKADVIAGANVLLHAVLAQAA